MIIAIDRNERAFRSRPRYIILIQDSKFFQIDFHGVWSHEWEEGVDAVLREVVRKGTK